MNWQTIFKFQGLLLLILAFMMLFPLIFSIYYNSDDTQAIVISILITLIVGLILSFSLKAKGIIRAKEGFIIVTLGWLIAACFGALPAFIHGSFGNYTNPLFNYIDCVFEAMSGFTTTGATILTEIETKAKGIIFWRSLTHWLGGMGIILLTIALLPIFGLTSGQLYNAEVPGPTKDRISPKIKDTAIILWLIYLGMTVLETVLLMFGGMSLYDALCHTFGTLATGGFSTLNLSVGGYKNLYFEIIIIIFMYLAGINFTLHFKIIKLNFKDFFKNPEWRFYTIVMISVILIITLNIHFYNYDKESLNKYSELLKYKNSFWQSLRYASFQVVSITTTTGFCTANFDVWPSFSKLLLILMMFFGGCAGSTGGGVKQIRVMIVLKKVFSEIKKLANPKSVYSVKISNESIQESITKNVVALVVLFVLLFTGTTLFLALMGYDIITSFAASIATLGNIGPGLAKVGAIENYAFFDPLSKVILTFSMLFGRLEVYSVLIMFYSIFHKK
jgi:trk system potassium uptake protein TrkH